jgi:F0F1-type ATP synthase assembly protein I
MAAALLLGLVIFLVPAGMFAYSVFTKRGRAGWQKAVQASQLDAEGRPLPLPAHPLARWLVTHPWATCAMAGAVVAAVTFSLLDPAQAIVEVVYGILIAWLGVRRYRASTREERRARELVG